MKARKYYFFGLILLVGFLSMDYFLNKKIMLLKNPKMKTVISKTKAESESRTAASVVSIADSESVSLLQFRSDFKYEVDQIGMTQANPDQIENRLQGLSRQMEPEHKIYLKTVLNNQNANGDDRAMAIELLTRNQTAESVEILKNYAANESTNLGARAEQELVFKAQAIEGLAAYQDHPVAISYLDEIRKKTSYPFLQDRARRAEAVLKNEGPAIETQDLDALKKIIR